MDELVRVQHYAYPGYLAVSDVECHNAKRAPVQVGGKAQYAVDTSNAHLGTGWHLPVDADQELGHSLSSHQRMAGSLGLASAIGPENHIVRQYPDEGIDIASRDGVCISHDESLLCFTRWPRTRRLGNPSPSPRRYLTAVDRALVDDECDLGVIEVEHVPQQEDGSFRWVESLQRRQQRHGELLGLHHYRLRIR